jgi:hypothetical protein
VREKRKKVWIDRFQTSLFVRITAYFVLYQIAVWSLVLLDRVILEGLGSLLGPGAAASFIIYLGAVVVVVGLLFAYDAVIYAHRIVGPLVRLRHCIKAVTAGEEVTLVAIRKGDLLVEFKDEFNEMLKVLEQRGAVVLKTTGAKEGQSRTVAV